MVTDILPTGIALQATTAPGWSCGLSVITLTCTRTDILAAGASYPAILLTVRPTGFAAATFINTVRVTDANDANPVNNFASDPTVTTF